MDHAELVDRLAAHRTIGGVPRPQLEWLASVGVERTFEPGDTVSPRTESITNLYVVFDGHLQIRVDLGAGPRIVLEWRGGDVAGLLPYSRIKRPPGDVVVERTTHVLAVDNQHFPYLIRECHELTVVFVHVMLDRARVFTSSELLDEKMASLGRLAAGLAHELNNPASAVARSAKTLVAQISTLNDATERFCALNIGDGQCAPIDRLRDRPAVSREKLPPLEFADRHDRLEDWMSEHDVTGLDLEPLVRAGIQRADLDELHGIVGSDKLAPVLAYIAAGQTVRQLGVEIDTAASRIHALVSAVKGFTYVNQQATLQPVDIGRGIADTVTVLHSKARMKSVVVAIEIQAGLPNVEGYGGELNQVWSNLLDNAIDAAPGGHVTIDARAEAKNVVVRVTDNGKGIPPEIFSRIFDPFFTTKDVGQGTGLGLDIARRIVLRHHGAIDVRTGDGGTQFTVTLPACQSGPP